MEWNPMKGVERSMEEEKWKLTNWVDYSFNKCALLEKEEGFGMRRGSVGGGFHFGKKALVSMVNTIHFFPLLFEQWKNICLILRFLEFLVLSIILFF